MFNLSYSRFMQLAELLIEVRDQEITDQYILQGFNAWLQGAGGKKKFKEFIRSLGLESKKKSKKESQTIPKEESKKIVERNLENAKKILLLDKRRKEG